MGDDFPERFYSWLICDIILTSNIEQVVTITGKAITERSTTPEDVLDQIFTTRNFAVATSLTRDFTWNRSWHALSKSNVKTTTPEEERQTNSGLFVGNFLFFGQNPADFGLTLLSFPFRLKDEFNIDETIQFDGTGQTARIRIIIQSQTAGWVNIGNISDDLSIDIAVDGKTMNLTHNALMPG